MTALRTRLAGVARAAWRFADPPLKAGRVPYTRTVLAMLLIAAVTFVGYTAVKKGARLPFSAKPYLVDVILPDANGLDPAKGPAAGVAGIEVGKVVAVKVQDGQARVTLRLPADLRGKIFKDATAFLRPASILQTLIVDVTPGSPRAGPLPDGEPITAEHTGAFVHIDKLTSVLDPDTQAQVQVLVSEAATALHGREPQLRKTLGEVGRLTDGASTLTRALDDRRRLLERLMSSLSAVATTVGDRGDQLAEALALANRTLRVSAARRPELRTAVRELAPTLAEAQRAFVAGRALGDSLTPALDALTPVAPRLSPLATSLRRVMPDLDRLMTSAGRMTRVGARPAHLFAAGLRGLNGKLRRDSVPALRKLLSVSGALVASKNGLIRLAHVGNTATSTNRSAGVTANGVFVGFDLGGPAEFGLSSSANRVRSDGTTTLAAMLAEALERTCRETNPGACWLRFALPSLPASPLLARPRTRQGR